MKKIIAILTVVLMAGTLFIGCQERNAPANDGEDEDGESQVSIVETDVDEEQAALHNKDINPIDVNLVQYDEPGGVNPVAVISTTVGDIEMVLFPEQAPEAVENFIDLAESGYYNGLEFYRVVNNYLIETGDPQGDGTGGESSFGEPFANEYSLDLWHFRGAVSMVNDNDNANTSKFMIIQSRYVTEETLEQMEKINYPTKVLEQYKNRGGVPGFDGRRTVFGMVQPDSLHTVDAIAVAQGEDERALEPIIIEDIVIREASGEDAESNIESEDEGAEDPDGGMVDGDDPVDDEDQGEE